MVRGNITTLHAAFLLAILCIGCGQGAEEARRGTFLLTVTYPTDRIASNHVLRIDEQGSVVLEVETGLESTLVTPPEATIGLYRAEVPPEQALELVKEARRAIRRGEGDTTPMLPDSAVVHLELVEENARRAHAVPGRGASRAIRKFSRRARGIAKLALASPARALKAEVRLSSAVVQRGESLRARLILKAIGSEPVTFVDPLDTPARALGEISLIAIRSDLAPEDLWPQHQKRLVLDHEHLVERQGPETRDGLCMLRPGESLDLAFDMPLSWEPGRWSVRVSFASGAEQEHVLDGYVDTATTELRME